MARHFQKSNGHHPRGLRGRLEANPDEFDDSLFSSKRYRVQKGKEVPRACCGPPASFAFQRS
jgi:hypothetical protein